MLRAASLVFLTIAATGTALAADQVAVQRAKRHVNLPAGLPRPHYSYRTTITPAAPAYVDGDPDVLFTPTDGVGGYIRNLPGTPLLPGAQQIPGYYGRAFSYDYQGPYYGGPNLSYFLRLPYACGVYGYC